MEKIELPPSEISENEVLVREVYSPFHVNLKTQKLKPHAFKPPSQRKDVSTLRLMFTTAQFCREHALIRDTPQTEYRGLAVIRNKCVISSGLNTIATPLLEHIPPLPMHADIIHRVAGPLKGVPLEAPLLDDCKFLADHSVYYNDPEKNNDTWDIELLADECANSSQK